MASAKARSAWIPTTPTIVGAVLVIAGFLLSSVSWWFILLTGLGAFGPGILRELGWLHDKDEFQMESARRAGYHAFLLTGLLGFVWIAFLRSGERILQHPQELATFFVAVLWFTWFLSSLLDYWGPQKTASRILIAFGVAWFFFTVASNTGSEWSGWSALLLHPLLTLPFFLLAWTARRWPRVTGALLLLAAAFFVWFFGWFRRENSDLLNDGVVFILFAGPLLAAGFALLVCGPRNGSGEDDEDEMERNRMGKMVSPAG